MDEHENMNPNNNKRRIASTSSSDGEPETSRRRDDEELLIAGKIAGIHMENFMCHANLKLDFDVERNNCFFIGGPNGSGKSAIFAAMNIGLGGKGSSNERGSSVKSYIKHDKNSAKIRIVLLNRGMNSFPEYGPYLAVERTINQTTSTYVLKSLDEHKRETIVSRKKSDVDNLVKAFNIHLNNPAFWMSQDRTRTYLANIVPTALYKLYMEATELDAIKEKYVVQSEQLNDLKTIVQVKNGEVKVDKRELKRMVLMLEQNAKTQELVAEIEVYKWKLHFAPIRDVEQEMILHKKKDDAVTSEQKRVLAESRDNRVTRREKMDKVIQYKYELDGIKDNLALVQDEIRKINENVNESLQAQRRFEADRREKMNSRNDMAERIVSAERKIEDLLASAGREDLHQQVRAAKERLDREKEKLESLKANDRSKILEADLSAAQREEKETQNDMYEARSDINRLEAKLNKKKELLESFKAEKESAVNKFGKHTQRILEQLEQRKSQFSMPPKGPLGRYIKVRDPQWALAIETALRAHSTCYMCNNSNDSKVITNIFNYLQIPTNERPPIIVSKFFGKRFNNIKEPPSDYDTILRMIDVDDDVANALIDRSAIEVTLLLPTDEDARRIMNGHAPKNARSAFTKSGAQAMSSSAGQYRFYCNPNPGAKAKGLFGAGGSMEGIDEDTLNKEIESISSELETIQTGLMADIERRMRQLNGKSSSLTREKNMCEHELNQCRKLVARLEEHHRGLVNQLNSGDEELEIENLRSSIADLRQRMEQIEEEIYQMDKSERESKPENPTSKDSDKLKKEEEGILDKLMKRKVVLSKMEAEVNQLDRDHDSITRVLGNLEQKQQQFFTTECALKLKLDDVTASVEETKDTVKRPETEDDPPDLNGFPSTERARQIIEEKTRQVEKSTRDIDLNITPNYIKQFKKAVIRKQTICKSISDLVDEMIRILIERIDMYPMMRNCTEKKVINKFKEVLEYRNFDGNLLFDTDMKTLNLIVKKRNVNKPGGKEDKEVEEDEDDEDEDGEPAKKKPVRKSKKQLQDLKGLSGGERSFVTAALLMALWEVMEQPFRLLDEFDVFMDSINRKVVIDLFVDLAVNKFKHHQFFYFTPQGIKEVTKTDGLQIFQMPKVEDSGRNTFLLIDPKF